MKTALAVARRLLLLLAASMYAHAWSSQQQTRRVPMSMALQGHGVCVVGLAGGAAETLCVKLMQDGGESAIGGLTAILDRRPYSPVLLAAAKAAKVVVYYGSDVSEKGLLEQIGGEGKRGGLSSLLSNKLVIALGDEGDETLRGSAQQDDGFGRKLEKQANPALPMLSEVLKALPGSSGVAGIVCALSVKDDESASSSSSTADAVANNNPLSKLMGGSSTLGSNAFRAWCAANNKPFSLFRYGSLIGGVPGAEPIPFISLPMLEPELHPSYVLQSVVLTSLSSNQYASTEMCTRNALAEAAVRAAASSSSSSGSSSSSSSGVEALVVSIAGEAAPSDKEWSSLFQRISSNTNDELLHLDFGSIKKVDAFASWIADSWFPQALIDADAATILSGARPVRAVKTSAGVVQIRWENIRPDLSVVPAGGLEIRLSSEGGTSASLSVVRLVKGNLPGEMALMDKLIEGVNKNVYKKGFATPL